MAHTNHEGDDPAAEGDLGADVAEQEQRTDPRDPAGHGLARAATFGVRRTRVGVAMPLGGLGPEYAACEDELDGC